jgi:hypothetical protein
MKITKTQLKQIIKEELEALLDEENSDDEARRRIEKSMGLEPGSIQSGEELQQAEDERIEKAAARPKKKVSSAPRHEKPYGGGSKNRPYGRST